MYAAATKDFKESQEGCYTFEDVHEDTLTRFIEWIYTGKYSSDVSKNQDPGCSGDAASGNEITHSIDNHLVCHARLYIFAMTYLIDGLKTIALENVKATLRSFKKTKFQSSLLPYGDYLDVRDVKKLVEVLDLTCTELDDKDSLVQVLGKFAAQNIVQLRIYSHFGQLFPVAGAVIMKYVSPYTGNI